MTNDEIRTRIFEITKTLNVEIKSELINLVYDLSNSEYKAGINKGSDIAREIFIKL